MGLVRLKKDDVYYDTGLVRTVCISSTKQYDMYIVFNCM